MNKVSMAKCENCRYLMQRLNDLYCNKIGKCNGCKIQSFADSKLDYSKITNYKILGVDLAHEYE